MWDIRKDKNIDTMRRIASVDYVVTSERSKLTRNECKTSHDWVGKVIHRELCKRLKFDYAVKWYMHKPESVLENETHKIF